jgi:hypothetical protein
VSGEVSIGRREGKNGREEGKKGRKGTFHAGWLW